MKRIQKKFQGTIPENKILNMYSQSITDTYSCDMINNLTGSGEITIVEKDPTVPEHVKNITQNDINKWNNNTGGITEETDPTVPEHVKNITQDNINNWNNNTYTAGTGINISSDKVISNTITNTSQLNNDSNFINEIKTINGQSLIGQGDITIEGGSTGDCNVVVSPTTPTTGEPVWVQYSYNLFDKSKATGGRLLQDGTVESHSSFKKSAYIPVEPNKTYTLQHNSIKLNNTFNCLYDKDKKFVTSIARNPGNNVINIPDGVYYIRVSLYLGDIGSGDADDEDNTFQMVEGSTALPYMAYNPAKDDRILLKKGDVYDELFAKSKLNSSGGITEETDPVFTNSPAHTITQNDINKWNNNTGGITEETDPIFTNSPAHTITQNDINKWNNGGGYTLPIASANTLGGVKIGANLHIGADGTLSATGGSSNEVVLYDNETGSNETITLSETSANFKYLEIFCKSADTTYTSVKVYKPNGKRATVVSGWFGSAAYFKLSVLTINGNTIALTKNSSEITGSNRCNTAGYANAMYITRVVGYRN